MSNVVPLKTKFVMPAHVVESLQKELPKLKDIYVVSFDKDGEPMIWASGDLSGICHAAILLTDTARMYARGEVDQE